MQIIEIIVFEMEENKTFVFLPIFWYLLLSTDEFR
jgi:hypothetical protein